MPSGLNRTQETLDMGVGDLYSVGGCLSFRFHTRAMPSQAAVANRRPSGLNVTDCTWDTGWGKRKSSLPVETSQTRAVPSSTAATTFEPSAFKAILQTCRIGSKTE